MRPHPAAMASTRSDDWRNSAVLLVVGIILGLQHLLAIDRNDLGYSLELHEGILFGDVGSPYRYRLLTPALLEVFARLTPAGTAAEAALLSAFTVFNLAGLTLVLLALYALVRQWFTSTHALAGALFTAGVAPIGFYYFRYHPWWITEVLLLTLGLLCAYRGRFLLLGILVVLAALNRETGIFLPLAVLSVQVGSLAPSGIRHALKNRETLLAFAYVCLSIAVFLGLRAIRDWVPPVDQLEEVIIRNLAAENLARAAYAVPLFLGVGWAFAALGWKRAPPFLRRASRVVPLYLLVFAIWGWWREVRILTTLYPLLVPLVIAYCVQSEDRLSPRAEPPPG